MPLDNGASLIVENALDQFPDDLIIIDRDFNICWSNHPHGVWCVGAFFPGEFDDENCPARQCFAQQREISRLLLDNAGRCIEVRAVPLLSDRNVHDHIFYKRRDVTEKTIYDQDSARISRLAALGELSAGVAHEINNPLGMILVNLTLLSDIFDDVLPLVDEYCAEHARVRFGGLNRQQLHDKVPVVLDAAITGAERIRRIVADLKEFVRPRPDHGLSAIDINPVVQTAVRLTESTLRKEADELKVVYAEDLPKVNGNSQLLEQVVVNLLINAGQALGQANESIYLRTYFDPSKNMVIIEVKDEGVGIPPDIMTRITDPFFTTRRSNGGTGLGLSLAAKIVEAHDGFLRFSSKPGRGTTVSLEIPALSNEGQGE